MTQPPSLNCLQMLGEEGITGTGRVSNVGGEKKRFIYTEVG